MACATLANGTNTSPCLILTLKKKKEKKNDEINDTIGHFRRHSEMPLVQLGHVRVNFGLCRIL